MLGIVLSALLAQATELPSVSPSATPTPVALYVIRQPDGWQLVPPSAAQPGAVELLSLALGPSVRGFRTKLNVIRDPLTDPGETIEARAKESSTFIAGRNHGKIVASHAAKVCDGNRDGWYLESNGTYGDRKLELVQTLLLDGGFEYVATYARPLGSDADPAAIHALDTLCPQPGGQ